MFSALSQALPLPGPTDPSSRKAALPRSWGPHKAVLSRRDPFGVIDGQPPQWALCPPAMCPQARGRLSSRTSDFLPGKGCAAPGEATPPSLPCALLQAARLEEWLSHVVRVAYVPKLNGMGGLHFLLGNMECRESDCPLF